MSDSSSSHKIYADDTQLYISFSAADFSHNIAHLEQTVSYWMSSNSLSLNPSKTEFLVIGLPKQLEKLNHPILFIYLMMSISHLLTQLVIWETNDEKFSF